MTESYEQLRDTTTGEAGAAWKAADCEESNLRALYRELKEDPRYTSEHKAEQAWRKYEAAKEKVAAGKTKARELLEKQARSGVRFSIPTPEGESPITSDTHKLLASQWRIVLFGEAAPRQTLPDNPEERCGSCGGPLWCVLRVLYVDAEGSDAA
jgi:hypothetical protein